MGRIALHAAAKSAVFTGFSASTAVKALVSSGRKVPPDAVMEMISELYAAPLPLKGWLESPRLPA